MPLCPRRRGATISRGRREVQLPSVAFVAFYSRRAMSQRGNPDGTGTPLVGDGNMVRGENTNAWVT